MHIFFVYYKKYGQGESDATYQIVKGLFSSIEVNAVKTAKQAVINDWLGR
jgi:hypothetical protein